VKNSPPQHVEGFPYFQVTFPLKRTFFSSYFLFCNSDNSQLGKLRKTMISSSVLIPKMEYPNYKLYSLLILLFSTKCIGLLRNCLSPEKFSQEADFSPRCEILLKKTNSLIECFGEEQISVSRPQYKNQDKATIYCQATYPIDIGITGLKVNTHKFNSRL